MKHFFPLVILLLAFCGLAQAESAADLTDSCTFSSNARTPEYSAFLDRDFTTWFSMNTERGELTVNCEEPMGSLFIQLYDRFSKPVSFDLQIPSSDGWETVSTGGTHLAECMPLPAGVTSARILATSEERLRIAELTVLGPGDPPEQVQRWIDLEKADLMLLSCHPDDELLWFGGLLPLYAGERGLRVQVVVMVPTEAHRKLELLSALWHCGVTAYPYFLNFPDNRAGSVSALYAKWTNKPTVCSRVARAVRIFKPEVLVTHAEGGEYGHAAHRVTADAAKAVYTEAAKENVYPKSAQPYGVWQIKKLYLHEYQKGTVTLDYDTPLSAFNGQNAWEVAEAAFTWHASQISRGWNIEKGGEHDSSVFGLYASEVGPDTPGVNDLMEHIPLPSSGSEEQE